MTERYIASCRATMNTETILGAIDAAVAAATADATAKVPVQPRFSEELLAALPNPDADARPIPPPRAARRPGRPPKVKTNMAAILGVQAAPTNERDLVEMVVCNPALFKKIFTLYRGYSVSEIEMFFGIDEVKLKAKDHVGRTTIYISMPGRLMNFYYCRDPMQIVLKREYLERILGAPEKDNQKITFVVREENHRSILYIIVQDMDYDKDNSYKVEIINRPASDVYCADNDTEYPLRFTLDSKHLKSEVLKIAKIGSTLTIKKVKQEPLEFTTDANIKPSYKGTYNNSEKIQLRSTLSPNDILTVSVPIEYIKPFTSSCIGEQVVIAIDKLNRLSLTTFADKKLEGQYAAEIKVFSDIRRG